MSGIEENPDYLADRLSNLVKQRREKAIEELVPTVLELFDKAHDAMEVKKHSFKEEGLTFKQGTKKVFIGCLYDDYKLVLDGNYYVYQRRRIFMKELVLHFKYEKDDPVEVFVYRQGSWEAKLSDVSMSLDLKKTEKDRIKQAKEKRAGIKKMNAERRKLMKDFGIKEDML